MRRIFLLFVLVIFTVTFSFAQRTVTGKVTNEDGEGLPGVTVIAKGTDAASITDLSGSFTLIVPDGVTTLIFRYIGYTDQEQPVSDVVNVTMKSDTEIEEVVVTALGITKDVKALGYSQTTVKSDELTKTRDRSALNALQGKVAGVNITSASSAPGASTRIIMRGFSSINGENQPLFIVDGVPVDNTAAGSTSINGGSDFGNGVNDINPDDIEDITILKGASGSALYGSRASNGVVIITTKSGKNRDKAKGTEITVKSNIEFSTISRLPQWQNTYGQGFFGSRDIRENTSWGPRHDGEMRYWGYAINGQRKIKPYEAIPDNVYNFFDVGYTLSNSVSFQGGNENSSFYASYSNVSADGVMPQSFDVYKRNTISVSGSSKLSNNFIIDGKLNYIKKQSKYVLTGQGEVSVYNNILQIPRDIPITELEDYKDPFNNLDNIYSAYQVNPYYILNEFGNDNNQDRVFGSIKATYQFNENLSAFYRLGTDIVNEQRHVHFPIMDPQGINAGNHFWGNTNEGYVEESSRYRRDINSDLIVSYTHSFDNFDFTVLLGNNIYQKDRKTLAFWVSGLDVENYYHISNSGNTPELREIERKRRLVGYYINADLSFFNMVYLTGSFRRDYSSTLPKKNNGYNYPNVNVSFMFTDAFPVLKKIVTEGKIRVGYAKVGLDAEPYRVFSVMQQAAFYNGYGGSGMIFPMANGLNAYSVGNLIGNPELSPEFKTELEIGTDLRFLKGLFVLDFTYYDALSTDQIFDLRLPYSSGYTAQTSNLGEVRNKGVEALLSVNPIRRDNFDWSFSINFAKNNNIVEKLPEELTNPETGEREYTILGIGTPGSGYTSFTVYEGYPLAVFTVPAPKRVEGGEYDGYLIVDANQGLPIVSTDFEKVGDSEYDYILGLGNSFRYKNLSFEFTIDIRQGGLMYSRTADMTYFSGTNLETTYNDRQPFVIPNSVVEVVEGGEVVGYVENTTPIVNTIPANQIGGDMNVYWQNGGDELASKFLIDKSFIKLRNISLSYSLPNKWMNKIFLGSVNFSVIGRNLLVYTPKDNRFIDPETTTFGNDLDADYGEFGSTPSIRSLVFSVQLKF
jgi:TonB-linked SusC/RagA family outer membrane protein